MTRRSGLCLAPKQDLRVVFAVELIRELSKILEDREIDESLCEAFISYA